MTNPSITMKPSTIQTIATQLPYPTGFAGQS